MILDVRNVDYFYKSQKKKQILKDVSIGFEEGRFYTIVGQSGAGKTTQDFLSVHLPAILLRHWLKLWQWLLVAVDRPIAAKHFFSNLKRQRTRSFRQII